VWRQLVTTALYAGALVVLLRSGVTSFAAQKKTTKKSTTVAGMVIDMQNAWIKVKADGEDEPVKYEVDRKDKKLVKALKGIFTVCRVQLTYKMNDDARQLVSIQKVASVPGGLIRGVVLENHDWWIEVKPPNGPVDGYAANFPFNKNKAMMQQLKELQKGDVVIIRYTTDGERHRIQALQKVGSVKKKAE
jgi:hypothetical protein